MNLTALKDKKSSNVLVALHITESAINTDTLLNECLYSLSKQTYKPDVLIMHSGLSEDSLNKLKSIIESPKLTLNRTDEEGKIFQETLESDGSINYIIEQISADNFAKIFNTGFQVAEVLGYEFYLIIEQEDIVGINWISLAVTFANELQDTSIFAPLTRQLVNGAFTSMLNEACWVERMAEQAGYFDMSLLTQFNALSSLGTLFRVSSISEYSEKKEGKSYPMKESMKLTNSYEFFLRMVYNDLKATTVQRIGYEMRMNTGKYFPTSSKVPQNISTLAPENGGLSEAEIKFYLELAKKEYFFEEDRNKVYEQQQQPAV